MIDNPEPTWMLTLVKALFWFAVVPYMIGFWRGQRAEHKRLILELKKQGIKYDS